MSPNIFGGNSSIPMSTLQFQRDISSSHSEFNPSGSSYTKTFACGVGGGGEAVEELKAKVEEEREKCKAESNKVRALQAQLAGCRLSWMRSGRRWERGARARRLRN